MNLKEYYKEILNNLLMTEVTASPLKQPVKPGSLRANRLAGLAAEHSRLTADPNAQQTTINRASRIAQTLAAKGAGTEGELNIHGHAARTNAAGISNEIRVGNNGRANDRRSPQKQIEMGNDRRYKSALESDM